MTEQSVTIVREIVTEIEKLPDDKVIEVLDFVRYLNTQSDPGRSKHHSARTLNEKRLAYLYAQSAEEDRQIAEMGMSDYDTSLKTEDNDAKG